jgi:hypothetical protein
MNKQRINKNGEVVAYKSQGDSWDGVIDRNTGRRTNAMEMKEEVKRIADGDDPIPNYRKQVLENPMLALVEAGYLSPNGRNESTKMVERQERHSTEAAARTSRLPIKGINDYREGGEYGYLGFKVGERCSDRPDELFCHVELPEGWKISTTGHSMWNDIVDEKGRKRSSYFFKGAFYDRSAHMSSPVTRYSVTPCGPKYQSPYNQNGTGYFDTVVIDTTKAKYDDTGKINEEAIVYRISEKRDDAKNGKAHEYSDVLDKKVYAWMDENYPGWKDPSKYWD